MIGISKEALNNFAISRLNIGKLKYAAGNTPVLNIFFRIIAQRLIDYRYPAHLFIETTRNCNLNCRLCPRNPEGIKSPDMDFSLFTKIIDEATTYGKRNFCLHMFGEPLLHPRIIEMVEYIKKSNRQHAILLVTNGYLMDAPKAEKILENNVDKVVFSFFSLKEDKNKAITGNSNISQVVKNIRLLVSLKRKMHSKARIYIRFILSSENAEEEVDFRRLAGELGVMLEIRPAHNYGGAVGNVSFFKARLKKRYPCYHPWFSPAITWDGKAVLCCCDWNYSTGMGDINKESLASLWQGQRLREFRACHLNGRYDKIPLCSKCDVWRLYPDLFFGRQKGKA